MCITIFDHLLIYNIYTHIYISYARTLYIIGIFRPKIVEMKEKKKERKKYFAEEGKICLKTTVTFRYGGFGILKSKHKADSLRLK